MVMIRAVAIVLNAILAFGAINEMYEKQGEDIGIHIAVMLLFILNITLIWR